MDAMQVEAFSGCVLASGAVVTGMWKGFTVLHKLLNAVEKNTESTEQLTTQLHSFSAKVEDHGNRILRLETITSVNGQAGATSIHTTATSQNP